MFKVTGWTIIKTPAMRKETESIKITKSQLIQKWTWQHWLLGGRKYMPHFKFKHLVRYFSICLLLIPYYRTLLYMINEFSLTLIRIGIHYINKSWYKDFSPKGMNYQQILNLFLYYSKLKSGSNAPITNENNFKHKPK